MADKNGSIPNNADTIFRFNLPYAIPVPDGCYQISLEGKIADISINRVQKPGFRGFTLHKGFAQIQFDKYGESSFSSISMIFHWKMDLLENGRTPLLLVNVSPRLKAREIVVRFLNRFIEVVRYTTNAYWIELARYQDLSSFKISYWDGKKEILAKQLLLETGVGGMTMCTGLIFPLDSKTLNKLNEFLQFDTPLGSSDILLLNAKDACLKENFRLTIIEAVAGLEVVLYKFIKIQGKILKLSAKDMEDFIIKVGLTGNITMVLKMLTKELEEIDDRTLNECRGAIKIRNKILHEGFLDVTSTDTEERVIAIEKMIDYLKRITP